MSEHPPHVEIALATYNGAHFLPEQLASIAAQGWPNIAIVASDDGSTDATLNILSTFAARPLRVVASTGGRGVRDNFAVALGATVAPYVFLSDQDDWWEADKVSAMMANMLELERVHGAAHPILVTCDLAIVDRDLQPTRGNWFAVTSKSADAHSLADLVLTGHVPGCAMAVNRALLDRALPIPADVYIHDWWLALLAATVGTIGYVDRPLIRYRQHGSNTLGAATAISSPGTKLRALLQAPFSGLRRQRDFYSRQAHVVDGNLAALRGVLGQGTPGQAPATVRALLNVLVHGSWWRRYLALNGARTGASVIAKAAITWHMQRSRATGPNMPNTP
jgi:glycosyltransferase involved in cell wall biosynthesis